jgi:hypothetical protein
MKRHAKIKDGTTLNFATKAQVAKQDGNRPITIKVSDRGFYLSKQAVENFGIKKDMYFHLASSDRPGGKKSWYFVVNDDPEDGFKVNDANHDAAVVSSRAMVRMFCIAEGRKVGDIFPLQDTGSELDGFKVIEVLTNKTTKELLKQVGQ